MIGAAACPEGVRIPGRCPPPAPTPVPVTLYEMEDAVVTLVSAVLLDDLTAVDLTLSAPSDGGGKDVEVRFRPVHFVVAGVAGVSGAAVVGVAALIPGAPYSECVLIYCVELKRRSPAHSLLFGLAGPSL